LEKHIEDILVLAPDDGSKAILDALDRYAGHVVITDNWDRCLARMAEKCPFMVFFPSALVAAGPDLGELRARYPGVQVVVTATADRMAWAFKTFSGQADDFLVLPAPGYAVDIVIQRGREQSRLTRALRASRENAEALAAKRTARRVETARFITAKQIVDKFSIFIGKIAGKAQGGLKFFDGMPYFVSIHDRGARVIAANPTHQKHFGNQIGANSWDIYRGKFSGPATCPVSKTIATGSVQTFKAAVEYLSGTRVPVIVYTAPIFDNEGEIILVLEVAAGSREIRKMGDEVRGTQQRYQKLFDEAPNYIAVLDRRQRITAVNRRFKEDFGENAGRPFSEVLRHNCPPDCDCPIRRTVEDAAPHHGEVVYTAPDGRKFAALTWTAPILSAARKLTQVFVILADVSEQRKLQDNLATLGLMIGSISHGLKGTLTGLDAGLYMVDTGFYRNQPARIEEGLDVAKLMTDHVRKMVSDILYYSKERDLEWQSVEVARFAGDVATSVETRIRAAHIEFSCRFDPGLGSLEMDAGLIRSALINILENAMEACIEDPEDKDCRIAFNVSGEKNEILFDISDNGGGMDPEETKNMFTLFYSSKGNRGTGLGLYITDKVIQKHGGSIAVDSSPGRGTRFVIRMPKTPARRVKNPPPEDVVLD
jgi:PAS domain S-box-containing protein